MIYNLGTRRKDYTNQRFNKLIVLEFAYRKGDSTYWKCRCDCGNEVIIPVTTFKHPRNQGCGCTRKKKLIESSSWRGGKIIGNCFLSRLKLQAKRRHISISKEITIEYLEQLLISQNNKCALSGQALYFPDKYTSDWYQKTNTSLDRIDSSKGYEIGNLQWTEKKINMMKRQLSQKEFIDLCQMVTRQFS